MSEVEKLLSLDLMDDDYLYRVRRGRRVVYISILGTDIIHREVRTDGDWVVSMLCKLPVWQQNWHTLTITTSNGITRYELDQFQPHRVDLQESRLHQLPRFNLFDLELRNRISDRVSQVAVQEGNMVLKIARFKYEVAYLRNEIQIYRSIRESSFKFAPTFIGYVYEEVEDRIIGFLVEELQGRHPTIDDLDACRATVQQLHRIGILHGDLNKYNIIIAGETAELIDFEASSYISGDGKEASTELCQLSDKLLDDSGVGYYPAL